MIAILRPTGKPRRLSGRHTVNTLVLARGIVQ